MEEVGREKSHMFHNSSPNSMLPGSVSLKTFCELQGAGKNTHAKSWELICSPKAEGERMRKGGK